ncbi:MAG: peptide ABC transporter substrate-binding protein [Patescibacteria group bacterium]
MAVFIASGIIFSLSSFLLALAYINENTTIVPVDGGKYTEGILGQPVFINPILAVSDADRDLTELLFDNLFNMAESYKTNENGEVWRYRIKDEVYWHDGQRVTSDDIIFTIELIQNPDSYSPLFSSWNGVKVSRISEREVEFKISSPYVFFKSNIEDLKPIPKHIFASIPPANIRLSNYNLEPIGSGPFVFRYFNKRADGYIKNYELEKNENYYNKKPYIDKLNITFYNKEDELINAFNSGLIDGLGIAEKKSIEKVNFSNNTFSLRMLKYYAVFFNPYSHQALKDKNVRLALLTATNKNGIIKKIFSGQATEVSDPLINTINETKNNSTKPEFSLEKAAQILESTGWKIKDNEIREKDIDKENVALEFILTVPEIPFLVETAELIKSDWEKIGIKLNLLVLPLSEINNNAIKNRDYQMILFGNILGRNPDIFSFWHSSERFYPGLNLSLYESKTADSLLETIRKDFNDEKRQSDLLSLNSLITSDSPAIFLYSPNYLYVARKNLGGFDSAEISFLSDRFKNIENWHVKTAKSFK